MSCKFIRNAIDFEFIKCQMGFNQSEQKINGNKVDEEILLNGIWQLSVNKWSLAATPI